MKISELARELKKFTDLKIPVLLVGETGVGKTSVITSLYPDVYIIRGSYVVPEMVCIIDLSGDLKINPRIVESSVIFIDELNQATSVAQNYLSYVIDYAIRAGKGVVAAVNIGSNYEVFSIPLNILARFAIINVEGDTDYLVKAYSEQEQFIKYAFSNLNLQGDILKHSINSPRQIEYFLKYSRAYGFKDAVEKAECFFEPSFASKLKAIRFDKIEKLEIDDLTVAEIIALCALHPLDTLVSVSEKFIKLGKIEFAEIIAEYIAKVDPTKTALLKAKIKAEVKNIIEKQSK